MRTLSERYNEGLFYATLRDHNPAQPDKQMVSN